MIFTLAQTAVTTSITRRYKSQAAIVQKVNISPVRNSNGLVTSRNVHDSDIPQNEREKKDCTMEEKTVQRKLPIVRLFGDLYLRFGQIGFR